MPINGYLLAKEKAFTNSMYRYFRKSQKQIERLLKQQDTQKAFRDDLKVLLEEIIAGTALLISDRAKPILEKGTKETGKLNPDFSINWELRSDGAVRYLEDIKSKHTDVLLVGSIGRTTYNRVIDAISEGIDQGLTYSQVADKFTEIDPVVFSKNRSKAIAVAELGTAYEYGKYLPIRELQDKGEIVLKKWQTVEDEKVRPTHRQNQEDGYIPLDMPFSGTGTGIAPYGYWCRCATIYKIL